MPDHCPPISPPILINPHEHRVIDTAHRDLVRVYVLGTSGFDVTTINPATVELDGAKPIAHFTRHFPHSEFLIATYVFVGSDINLPAGLHDGDVHGPDLQRPADHHFEAGPEHPVLGEGSGPAALPDGQGIGLPALAPT